MTAFPLPPTYRVTRCRRAFVALEGCRRVSWAWRDTYEWRVRLWEIWMGWA